MEATFAKNLVGWRCDGDPDCSTTAHHRGLALWVSQLPALWAEVSADKETIGELRSILVGLRSAFRSD